MTTDWQTLPERPGYLGKRRDSYAATCDADYGPGNWRLAWKLGERYLSSNLAYQIYEDAY